MSTEPTQAQRERRSTRKGDGRFQRYESCGHCTRTITEKSGHFHLADEPSLHEAAVKLGKDPKALVCGKCADLVRRVAEAPPLGSREWVIELHRARAICFHCGRKGVGNPKHPHAFGHYDHSRYACRFCGKGDKVPRLP